MLITLSTQTGVVEWTHQPISDKRNQIMEMLGDGAKQTDIAKKLNLSRSYVSKVAKEWKQENRGVTA
jgi:DNA-binding NarL/FixJ family response regulator